MNKIYVFLADGFEEIEGLTVVDLVRRAGLDVETVSITGSKEINGAHGIRVLADRLFEEGSLNDGDMLVLPGGMPGTRTLQAHEGLKLLLLDYQARNKKISAICAAPSVLGAHGLLQGKRATCYPGFEEKLLGATAVEDRVVIDGNIITSRGLGTAIDFSLEIITLFLGKEASEKVAKAVIYR